MVRGVGIGSVLAWEHVMILLGVILLLLGHFLRVPVLRMLGVVLIVLGVLLYLLKALGTVLVL